QWGVDNGCFLGHTFVGCETDGNGLGTSAGNNGKTSVVSYGGNLYRAVISETTGSNNGIMSESNRRLLATAQPGTNDSAWRLVEPGTPTPDYPLWTPGRELHYYTDGGGFKVSNSNGRHVMFGCRSGQREKNGNRITGPFAGNYGGYQPYFGGGGQIQSAYGGQINAAGLGASSGNNKIQFLENIPNGDILSIYRQDEDG